VPVRAESRTLLPRYSVLTGLSATVTVTGRGYIVPPGPLVNLNPSYLKEEEKTSLPFARIYSKSKFVLVRNVRLALYIPIYFAPAEIDYLDLRTGQHPLS
jgi:hypothetical protein